MRRCWLALVLLGCGDSPEGNVAIVTGDETDTFSRAPAPASLVVEKVALDGTKTEIRRTNLPADSLDLGDLTQTDYGGLSVRGLDPGGNVVVRGETLFLQWGALDGVTLDLFVQRTGELARMPSPPAAFGPSLASVVAGRYAFSVQGTSTQLYDLLELKPLSSPPLMPRAPKSIAIYQTSVLAIDDAGATTVDIDSGSRFETDAPTGGTFLEVSGGMTTSAKDGTQYVVGATRVTGGATTRVLSLDVNGRASFASLVTPRENACATWVEGRGLVVAGGSPDGAGAEVLAPGATVATALPFPADPTRGCALSTLDGTHVVITGGTPTSPARVLDLTCAASCTPLAWADPIPLVQTQAFGFAPDAAFVVGDDAAGATHAYRASAGGLREITVKNPRRGARLLATPTESFIVLGGNAPGVEQYLE